MSTLNQKSLFFANSGNNIIGDSTTGCSLTTGTDNNFLGCAAGRLTNSGSANNFFGRYSGCNNTSGSCNNFFGDWAGCSNTTGRRNTFLGVSAGMYNTSTWDSIAIGSYAGVWNSGCKNIYIGCRAGGSSTRTNDACTTGINNIFIGSLAGAGTTVGIENTFIGVGAGFCNTRGARNSFFGGYSGFSNFTACNNSFFGYKSGCSTNTGGCNVFLGTYSANSHVNGSYNVAVGYGAQLLDNSGSCQLVISTNFNTPLWIRGSSDGRLGFNGASPDTSVSVVTNDSVSGDAFVNSSQLFRLTANGSAIGPAIANFFGANSAISLAQSGVYLLEAHLRFTKNTSSTVRITLTTSSAPANISATVDYAAPTIETADGPARRISLYNSTATGAEFGLSASLTTGSKYTFIVKALIEASTSAASDLRINITSTSGTVTPLQTSYYTITRLPSGNEGTFVA